MPLEKQFNTFVKGLITEANALSFPENAALDESNLVLNKDGSLQRRLGVDYEENYAFTQTYLSQSTITRSLINFFRWDSPGGDTTISIGIIRIFDRLWFINLLTNNPSATLFNSGYAMPISGMGNSEIDITFINNLAVIVSKSLPETVVLTYDQITGQVFQESIPILVRDIWGVADGLSPSERPSELSDFHRYNLINQGWNSNIKIPGTTTVTVPNPTPPPKAVTNQSLTGIINESLPGTIFSFTITNNLVTWQPTITKTVPSTGYAIDYTKTILGVYPSNSDIWTLGKISDSSSADFQKYDPNVLAKNSVGNVYSPKASVIIDLYNRGSSRRNTTGLQELLIDKEQGRASTVAAYAGRVFYSGILSNIIDADARSPNYNSYIVFSQIVTTKEKLSLCYQEADPTDIDISDIVDTDGGTIQIPEITSVTKLLPALSSLLVFAENGIWEIYGDTGGFKATSFQTSKITSIGVLNKNTVIEVNGSIYAWSNSGIISLAPDEITGRYTLKNISLQTIQTYYNNIPEVSKLNATVFYSQKTNCIRWMYNDLDGYSSTNGLKRYNKELILDLTLEAFYTAEISSAIDAAIPYVNAYVSMPSSSVNFISDGVIVGDEDVIVTDSEGVIILIPDYTTQSVDFKFLTTYNDTFTLSSYRDTSFYDWQTQMGTAYPYMSYIVTGYELAKDLMRTKEIPYIFTYFKKTETGFTEALEFLNPSSCYVQAQWNWCNTEESNRWGVPFQAYRFLRVYTPSGAEDTFNNGDSIVVTKNKLRGNGKAISLKFYSENGKDMHILGWAYPINANKVL